jgi:hypothetical protein
MDAPEKYPRPGVPADANYCEVCGQVDDCVCPDDVSFESWADQETEAERNL